MSEGGMTYQVEFVEQGQVIASEISERPWATVIEENRPYLAQGTLVNVWDTSGRRVHFETITDQAARR